MKQETAVTIVSAQEGALDAAFTDKLAGMVKSAGVERLRVEVLHSGKAADIILDGNNPELTRILRGKLQVPGFDVFVQPNDDWRKKKLLVADMDATIVEGETLDELAAHLNLKDKIAPITARAMNGEIDFKESLELRIALLKGTPVSALMKVTAGLRFSKGADVLVRTMNGHGARCVLVSGGFDIVTGHVAGTLGFYKDVANRLEIDGERLTGRVIHPIVDRDTKRKVLEDEARLLHIDPRQTMAVGDGANDIEMLKAAGTGVAYFAKPVVQSATPHWVRYTDLGSLLYMQGYSARDFI